MNVTRIEDIYPLTIVGRRFGGVAIIEADAFCGCVDELQSNEEWHYGNRAHREMEDDYGGIHYGLGETVDEAFRAFLSRKDDIDRKWKERLDKASPMTGEEREKFLKMLPPFSCIGISPVITQEMEGPKAMLFYLDAKYSGETN